MRSETGAFGSGLGPHGALPPSSAQRPPGSSSALHGPKRQAIIRAVASSTAIETGQRIHQLERTLRSASPERHVALAR